ncbi:RCC1 domain-containing protein [Nakamurella multipartita]|uniref:Fibronectin type III domain protein n=1 Tax=Nakamurella multipartita (strain ATCC 700099 / DSM 44233 / CIP 104796 / JCM 9543 / NBRC 105858 / Y-104) TaxID=479431 RepID=C8XKU6_NAKMY|nr:fibronectin type III domain-containing protein [Nakamurella multipartita]ACV80753.1 Fibronectin type III domain protein [Nakamurella multipartita DSM 44233]
MALGISRRTTPVRTRLLSVAAVLAMLGSVLVALAPAAGADPQPKTIVAWGRNTWGESNIPTGMSDVKAISTAAHSLVLKNDGTVVAWGDNEAGETNVPAGLSDVVAIAAGGFHSLALRSDGTVVAWGANVYNQSSVPAGLTDVVAISGGRYHSLALRGDGTVVAWGQNNYGQSNVPAGLNDVVAIDAGGTHSLALRSDGTVVAWGNNANGQATVPAGLSDVVAVAAGWNHSLALRGDGTVVAWGSNADGQATVPAGLSNVVAVSAGATHSLVALADGTVVAWGGNAYGETRVPVGLSGVTAITGKAMNNMVLADDPPPTPVTNLAAPTVTGSKVRLTWQYPAQATDRDIQSIVVRRSAGVTPPASPTDGDNIPMSRPLVEYTTDIHSLLPGQQFTYAVFAIDKAGNVGAPASITVPAQFPSPVTSAQATANSPFDISLTWHNPTDVPLTKVVVRRADGATPPPTATSGKGISLSPALAESTENGGLLPNHQYSYSIFVRDGIGNDSELGPESTVTITTPADLTPPPPVSDLQLQASTSTTVTLAWVNTASPDNDLNRIVVRRFDGATSDVSPTGGRNIGVRPTLGESTTDGAVVTGRTYTYAVYEQDRSGNSSTPAVITVSVPA